MTSVLAATETSGRQAAAHDADRAEPLWVLRVNPLPRSRASDEEMRRLLTDVVQTELKVRAAAGPCIDELYEQIGSTVDNAARRALIALRRAVHNDRSIPEASQDPGPATTAWLVAHRARADARDRVAGAHHGALHRERERLCVVLDDEHLRNSLALVAPEVFQAAERYRAAVRDGTAIPARVRKTERGLVQYATRAMVRTSPLARFTAVGLAVPGAGAPPDRIRFDGAVTVPGLDRVMLGYVLAGLLDAATDPLEQTWVQLPPTAQPDPDGANLYFLLPGEPSGIRRLSAQVTPGMRLLLDATAMGPRRVSSVAADVAARSGLSIEQATQVVCNAVRAGVLCTVTGPEDGAAEFDTLLDDPRLTHGDLRAEVRQRLPRLARADPPQRDAELRRMRAVLSQLSHLARRPAEILVEEDYVLRPSGVSTERWKPALSDLAAGVELLSVFDRLHDVRALLAAAFVERFGAGGDIPLVEHAAFLADEVVRRGGAIYGQVRAELGPADGSLRRLNALRERIVDTLHDRIGRCQAVGEDVRLSVPEVTELTAGLPDRFRAGPLAYGVLVQTMSDGLVFNDAFSGHGMLFGRFLGADQALGGTALDLQARRLLARYGADGSRVVEDRGLHRLNVNAHAPVLPDALSADDWYGLRLVHDPGTDRLAVRDPDGREVRVMTLGSGHPELVPPALRIATWLVTGGRLLEFLVDTWHRLTLWDGQTTRRCPRLFVGSALLARRRWYGGAELDAAVAAGPAEVDRLLALAAWRARHGVPEEVMFKTPLDAVVIPGTGRDGGPDDGQPRYRNSGKPQYADLSSALHSRVLPRMLDRREPGYVEEALPAVAEGGHAVEWIVEISRTAGRRFQYGGALA